MNEILEETEIQNILWRLCGSMLAKSEFSDLFASHTRIQIGKSFANATVTQFKEDTIRKIQRSVILLRGSAKYELASDRGGMEAPKVLFTSHTAYKFNEGAVIVELPNINMLSVREQRASLPAAQG